MFPLSAPVHVPSGGDVFSLAGRRYQGWSLSSLRTPKYLRELSSYHWETASGISLSREANPLMEGGPSLHSPVLAWFQVEHRSRSQGSY